jgi:hypothetical protein
MIKIDQQTSLIGQNLCSKENYVITLHEYGGGVAATNKFENA